MKKYNAIIISLAIFISCGFAIQIFGMANPAAVYCEELGYKYVIKETADGQQGFCQFPNRVIIDGWKFFVGEEGVEYNYCQKQGYETKTIYSEKCQYASKCTVCVLKDGREVKVTELMELNLKSTLLPWNPERLTDNKTEKPELLKTNYFFYAIIIFLIITAIVYKKIRNRDNYYK